jgi:hypothetical protein
VSVLDGGTLIVGGATKIYSGSTLTLGTSTFTSAGIIMEGGTIAASAAAGENGGLFLADVGQLSGYGDISLLVHLGESGVVAGSGSGLNLSGGLTGSGSVSDAVLGGSVDIGNSAGVLELEDVVVDSTSIFGVEIGGTTLADYDRILLAGGVTLDGVLNVSLTSGFVPTHGDTFQLIDLDGATVTGWFSQVNLPACASLDTTGELLVSLATSQISGDFDGDGDVDAADYTVWQDNLGLSASALNGNGSGAATVVQADYLLWKTNFEALATGSEGTAAVPEPATLLLALLALTAAAYRVPRG